MWNLPDAHAGTPDQANSLPRKDPLPATSQRIPASPIPSRLRLANHTPISPIPYHTAPHRQLSGLIAYRFPSLRHPSLSLCLSLIFLHLLTSSSSLLLLLPLHQSHLLFLSLSSSLGLIGVDQSNPFVCILPMLTGT